jgi:hypothetical protein
MWALLEGCLAPRWSAPARKEGEGMRSRTGSACDAYVMASTCSSARTGTSPRKLRAWLDLLAKRTHELRRSVPGRVIRFD